MTRLDTLLWRRRDTIERHDAEDGSQVRFEFPLGFQVIAARRGISFAGNSMQYDIATVAQIEDAIKWAKEIVVVLAANGGIPPQAEIEGRLVMQGRGDQAWWKGSYKDRITAIDGVPACQILRKMVREEETASDRR